MKQLIKNDSLLTIFRGGKMIPPGETRTVELIAMAQPQTAFDPALIMENSVKELSDLIVELNIEQLEACLHYEEQNGKRKTAIEEIQDAIENVEKNAELAEFSLSLSSVEDLDALLLSVKDDDDKVELVEFEKASREQEANQ